ncbi:hypothetical protein F2Q69_00000973 [Brassica cretica]|uniref:Pentacotripeptide-repeat region of PRORP domain-containing protein n=1 Tax=Brassica cretica TaxID=69181 RepID=A0A8S9NYR6_BRACR|nr:hypothetical protein F2Q69_00000973 [Brassica cretica]
MNKLSSIPSKVVECVSVTDARKVSDEMPKKDISGWFVMIGACARNGYYQESLGTFREMKEEGLKFDGSIVLNLLKASRNLLYREFGKMIHCMLLKCSFNSGGFEVSLLSVRSLGEVENARKVFRDLAEQDLVVFKCYDLWLC